jgi:ATP-dependent Clp protease ATP-binding subunit ClpA
LLDEIEKAHPDLFNILLQIMDHGKLTDHNGKSVDFRNVVLIMTTNAGAADLAKPAMGFTRIKREGDDQEAINRLFAPEFRNRLDATISFAPLPRETIARVVDKFIAQLDSQLAERKVSIELSDEARDWLIEHGYDEAMGARPMGRLIQSDIKTPLADELLFGRLKKGGIVRVIVGAKQSDDDKATPKMQLGFEYPDTLSKPKPEKELVKAKPAPKKASAKSVKKQGKAKSRAKSSDSTPLPPRPKAITTVPKLPLNKS